MKLDTSILTREEEVSLSLCALYGRYGYTQYKMSKFEEYDLYVRNKSFLLSDSVITFTDTNGKLMALKPDVTLSIVKNSDTEGGVQKLYYNESVYRISERSHAWREIMQTGLECLGDLDAYQLAEVLELARESLATVSDRYVLDVSHLGLLSTAITRTGLSDEDGRRVLAAIGQKNRHEILSVTREAGIPDARAATLLALCECASEPQAAVELLASLYTDREWQEQVAHFGAVLSLLDTAGVRVDFSVIHDISYYNGIVFQGFVEGVPERVLSGGQYDRLMEKLGKRAGAIGFAVYPETLERLSDAERFDVDTLLLYSDGCDKKALAARVKELAATCASVRAQRIQDAQPRARRVIEFTEEGECVR